MTNKTILITGANKGIGFEIAKQLGEKGHFIIVAARNLDLGLAATEKLTGLGIKCDYVQLDVTHESTVIEAAGIIAAKYNHIDVLVNCAGILLDMTRKLNEISLDEFKQTIDVNLFGVFNVSNAFLPLLKLSAAGQIINLSSDLGSLAQAANPESKFDFISSPAYRAAKAAVNMLTLSYARELRDSHIEVNAVSPGWCKTDLGGPNAPNSAASGADTVVWLAEQSGYHGSFLSKRQAIEW